MDEKERAEKDIRKLERMLKIFTGNGFADKYPEVFGYAQNYHHDAVHFFKKGEFFDSFGAANYAYGFLDAVLVIEGKKDESTAF